MTITSTMKEGQFHAQKSMERIMKIAKAGGDITAATVKELERRAKAAPLKA